MLHWMDGISLDTERETIPGLSLLVSSVLSFFVDRNLRSSQVLESIQFGCFEIAAFLFAEEILKLLLKASAKSI